MRRQLSLETLIHLDGGRIAKAFDQALARLAADLDDRPGDDRPRKLTLEVLLTPQMDGDAYDDAKVQILIKDKTPERRSKKIDLQPTRGNRLVFNDLSEDDVNQRTIDEMTGEE